ncbi:MAG: pyruvate kinase, partial [Promethearchaeota archaeon]
MSFRENTVKIVSTLGPASSSKTMLRNLIDTGVDIFRLNFSHGTHDEKRELIKRIREVDEYTGILADIQGPKIRVGKFKEDQAYSLAIGQEVKVFEKEIEGNQDQFSIPLEGFLKSMKVGDIFFVNDGIIKIKVIRKEEDYIVGEVLAGGMISNRKGVNIPTGELSQKVPTEKDVKDLEFIAEISPEYVAISFVAGGDDVLHVKKILENYGNSKIKLISKIERPIALDNFDQILEVSDGI